MKRVNETQHAPIIMIFATLIAVYKEMRGLTDSEGRGLDVTGYVPRLLNTLKSDNCPHPP